VESQPIRVIAHVAEPTGAQDLEQLTLIQVAVTATTMGVEDHIRPADVDPTIAVAPWGVAWIRATVRRTLLPTTSCAPAPPVCGMTASVSAKRRAVVSTNVDVQELRAHGDAG
jgi:hypothetical protein